ncbi:MAG: hypothetical protein K6U74_20035, partial [Firmicutes bacterium]|nr:hypothetical protein [Bacillota bacterium]
MMKINPQELEFIEEMGLLFERSGGSKTLGRVFCYLMLAGKPKNLDEIAADLLFSKATASLTIRQGLALRFFEKVSIPGERKDYYRAYSQSWICAMNKKIHVMTEWERLIEHGLQLVPPDNRTALENFKSLKDYFEFMHWYLSDIAEQY